MLSFQLHVEGDNLGALNLYSYRPGALQDRRGSGFQGARTGQSATQSEATRLAQELASSGHAAGITDRRADRAGA